MTRSTEVGPAGRRFANRKSDFPKLKIVFSTLEQYFTPQSLLILCDSMEGHDPLHEGTVGSIMRAIKRSDVLRDEHYKVLEECVYG